jgi:hypothetical protein
MEKKQDDARQTTRQERLEGKEHLGDETPAPSFGGVKGGTLNEDVGTRDEEKRAFERPGGATRVRKSDKQKNGP